MRKYAITSGARTRLLTIAALTLVGASLAACGSDGEAGYLSERGLLSYRDDLSTNSWITTWGDDTTVSVNKSSGQFTARTGGLVIADGEDLFIPALDGSAKVLAYSTAGSTKEWKLPASLASNSSVNIYRLTAGGRSFEDALPVTAGAVMLTMLPSTGYAITPTGGSTTKLSYDLGLESTVNGSSNGNRSVLAYNSTTHRWAGRELVSIPASQSPTGNWSDQIRDLQPAMFDANGGLRYEQPVLGTNAADGTVSTYWTPNWDSQTGVVDMADGDAWLTYTRRGRRAALACAFARSTSINRMRIADVGTSGNRVTAYQVQSWNGSAWSTLASGTTVPSADITFPTVTTSQVRLLLTSAESTRPRIGEWSVMSAP